MSASGGDLAREIGNAVLDDDLLREAVDAYSEQVNCDLPTCVAWLLKHALAAPAFAYLGTRQVTEFVAGPKLEKHRAATTTVTPRAKRRRSNLKLVSTTAKACEEAKK